MTTHTERQRLAAMANALRPDWNIRSLYTLLTDDETLARRAYRDVATALAWVGTDPDTRTPARLAEPGPWWGTAATSVNRPANAPGDKAARCKTCGLVHTALSPCSPPGQRSHGAGAAAARAALHATAQPEEKP